MIPRFKSPLSCSHSFINSWKRCASLIPIASSTCEETQVLDCKSTKQFWPRHQTENFSNASPYYIENGLRKVYPYYFPFSTHCKGRWMNRTFIDVYCNEFASYRREEVERRILSGRIKVNGKIFSPDYKLKTSDFITSTVHRHELAVSAAPIEILHEDEDLLIVDKPPSIPVHPCGMYRYNSVIFILGQQQKWKDLQVTHRIDRLTSGVLILTKNSNKSREIHKEMNTRCVRKEYLCRVEGEFPDGVILCNKPLKKIYKKMGVSLVSSLGKESITEFQKLSFNGKSSVVLCKPLTGRTHQIRVHLQYLGYPILNDPLYNSYAFGPDKGKHGELHKSVEQLLVDLLEEHSSNWWLDSSPCESDLNSANGLHAINLKWETSHEYLNKEYRKDKTRITHDKDCIFCQKSYRDPNQTHLLMFLHALKYKGKNWEYLSEMPEWASSDWNFM